MNKSLRIAIQYIVILSLTAGLLWLSLRSLVVGEGEDKATFIFNAWRDADKFWLLAMVIVAYVSHVLRAERWRMLLEPAGYRGRLLDSFLSLMVGYMVNLAVPRGGEVSRCYNLFKLDKTPVEVSFGTVVIERMVDVLCLLGVIGLAFLAEWDKLVQFIESLGIGKSGEGSPSVPVWLILAAVLGVVVVVAIYLLRKNERIRKILAGFREGLTSVFKIRQKALFVFYSIAIWTLYFGMSYCVILAFDTTQHLGLSAVLTLFALGAIAMAAPLPGGTGSYHTIVPAGLVMLYGLPSAEAIAFVFIFHAWQTLTMIAGGVVSLIGTYLILRWRARKTK